MRLKSFSIRILMTWLIAACLSPAALAAASTKQTPAPVTAATLENSSCQSCHDGKKGKLEVTGTNGTPRVLKSIPTEAFAKGVHAEMQCVACHSDITDNAGSANKHQKNSAQSLNKVDCAGCHQELWAKAQKDGNTGQNPRLGVVGENIEVYKKSFHARPNADDKTKPNASCDDCHDTHTFDVPPADTPERAQWRLGIPATCGESCHTEQLETYRESVHGQNASSEDGTKTAVCSDCHSAHDVGNTSAVPFKLSIVESCGNCHEANLKSYKATYHGQINTLGFASTAKCFNCHGSHDILKVADPKSKVHVDNRMKTCRECHGKKEVVAAPDGFASFQPHGTVDDFEKYPQMWVAWKMMVGLLVSTFAFFWFHTGMWFYREYKERKQRGKEPRVKIDDVPIHLKGKHIRRFSRTWRIAHLTFALCLMTLAITGMPLFFPEAIWASAIINALGGPVIAGEVHRVAAVIFGSIFVWHLFYVLWGIARDWKNFKVFGSHSMVPNLKDGRDLVDMFKWFFGKGPRPVFDRWTYWEKFDYWAPFWGVTVVGTSGLIMWRHDIFGMFLPGWVFNIAPIFHGEEAFLAVVFLFTVHFFNNHFRPDKFPLDVVMFTGTWSLEEFKHEHTVEYNRLVATGELEKRLVDAPTSTQLATSKVLGFTLLAAGLTILTMVIIGFFTAS